MTLRYILIRLHTTIMNIIELIKSALNSLGANKTRTALTMLGIVIGIGSVIGMLSLGSGAQATVEKSISALGTNTLTITSGSQTSGLVQGGFGSAQTLKKEDADAIVNAGFENLAAVAPQISSGFQITANKNNTNASVVGSVPDYKIIRNYEMREGSFITNEHLTAQAKVAVLGPDTAKNLFGEGDAIGQFIKINLVPFKVIGVTQAKGSNGFTNQDDFVIIPLSTAQNALIGRKFLSSIVVQGRNADSLPILQEQITSLLLSRHKITNPDEADFTIRSSADTLATLSSVTGTFTTLLAGIAAISLLVGGIGIMNIMIVTVTERTREIGLRKAVGATNKIILSQFLVEAAVLTFIGGGIGIVIGVSISLGLSSLLGLEGVVTLSSILLASTVSILIGLVFGLYPAYKASKLSPIEALRFE